MRFGYACLLTLAMTVPACAVGPELPSDPPPVEDEGFTPTILPRLGWLRSDYLVWFVKHSSTPSLIQSVSDSGTVRNLFPDNNRINYNAFAGVRVNGGFWFDGTQRLGLDLGAFGLEQRSVGAAVTSNNAPVLARFYLNANNGLLDSLQFAGPGTAGTLRASATLNSIYGIDANLRWHVGPVYSDATDFLIGARALNFREGLDVAGTTTLRGGTTLYLRDHFAVSNQFVGPQLGVQGRWLLGGNFSIDGTFKFAMGTVRQRAVVNGENTLTPPSVWASARTPGSTPGRRTSASTSAVGSR
jgi:hypothetical protein